MSSEVPPSEAYFHNEDHLETTEKQANKSVEGIARKDNVTTEWEKFLNEIIPGEWRERIKKLQNINQQIRDDLRSAVKKKEKAGQKFRHKFPPLRISLKEDDLLDNIANQLIEMQNVLGRDTSTHDNYIHELLWEELEEETELISIINEKIHDLRGGGKKKTRRKRRKKKKTRRKSKRKKKTRKRIKRKKRTRRKKKKKTRRRQ